MPYHIKKESILGSSVPQSGNEYYIDNNTWSNDFSKRKIYATEEEANTQKNITYTTSLGINYQPNVWKNSIVVSE
jgi:hypothetical protein